MAKTSASPPERLGGAGVAAMIGGSVEAMATPLTTPAGADADTE
jgi:hypothetical protein